VFEYPDHARADYRLILADHDTYRRVHEGEHTPGRRGHDPPTQHVGCDPSIAMGPAPWTAPINDGTLRSDNKASRARVTWTSSVVTGELDRSEPT
jgi:hypothetical protein